jgi:hypothetical protein
MVPIQLQWERTLKAVDDVRELCMELQKMKEQSQIVVLESLATIQEANRQLSEAPSPRVSISNTAPASYAMNTSVRPALLSREEIHEQIDRVAAEFLRTRSEKSRREMLDLRNRLKNSMSEKSDLEQDISLY